MDTRDQPVASPPLLVRLTPRWLRNRLRRSARNYAATFVRMALEPRPDAPAASDPGLSRAIEDRILTLASLDGKHLPIDPGADSYVIPMGNWEDSASPDGMPVPPKDIWWDYADTPERFLEIGRQNVAKMRSVLIAAGRDITPGDRILDFGCAAGPQLRCLREFADEHAARRGGEVWGVDVSAPHVTWCMHNLPPCFRFAVTTTAPHLPFEDRHFDLIYCGSVFSHISEMTDAWLLELSRLLRPGGRLYLTMNSKQSLRNYLTWWPTLEFSRTIRGALPGEKPWESDFAVAVVGRSVWQHSVYNLSVFQRKCEQAHFRVLSVNRNAYSFQTALLLERLDTRRQDSAQDAESLAATVRSHRDHVAQKQ